MNIHTYIDYIDDPNDTYEQYLEFKGINGSDNDRKTVIYTRVSTNGQKDDLKNQIEFLLNFTSSKGIIVDETLRI